MADKPTVDLTSKSKIRANRREIARSNRQYDSTRNFGLKETGEHLSSSVAGSAFKFLLIIPLFLALFASLNGGQNVMHFETMLDMLAGAPTLDISWISKVTDWTSGMSDIAQKIFGFLLKPIEWGLYLTMGFTQILTFIGYISYYIFAF